MNLISVEVCRQLLVLRYKLVVSCGRLSLLSDWRVVLLVNQKQLVFNPVVPLVKRNALLFAPSVKLTGANLKHIINISFVVLHF